MYDHRFKDVIVDAWKNDDSSISTKISTVVAQMKKWNKDVFGSGFTKKKRLLARLNGVQKAMERNSSPFLFNLNRDLHDELILVLQQEEVLWFQKSTENWLTQGDRNTSYYHLSTIIKRRGNKLEGLFDSNKNWIEDKEGIKKK